MKYKKIECKNYDIYVMNTKKFKTVNISTVVMNKYDEKDVTKEQFISDYLTITTNSAKDEVSMNKKYMELYEPRISVNDLFRDIHYKMYDLTFLNEKYTEKGMSKKSIEFLCDIIFDPNIENGAFDKKSFEILKDEFRSMYLRDEEDSSSKAYFSALKTISEDIPLRIDTRGNIVDLEKLNNKDCYEYYINRLNTGKFTIFITGDVDDELVNIVRNSFDKKVKDNNYEIIEYFDVNPIKEEREVIENSNFKQSIVYIIYKIFNMTKRERRFVLPILSNILGGSSAKLFNNVREKNSMAYYCYSDYMSTYNIFYMYAGISSNNYNEATRLMKKELQEIVNGNITAEEINGARESLIANIFKTEDSITGISNSVKGKVLFNLPIYDEYKKEYQTVTIDEIISLAKKIELDVTYLLKGDN